MKQHSSIAPRRFLKNRIYSIINFGGIVMGIAVTLFLGYWVAEEISVKKVIKNNHLITNSKTTIFHETKQKHIVPLRISEELRISFGNNFELVVLTTKNENELLTNFDKKVFCQEITASNIKNY